MARTGQKRRQQVAPDEAPVSPFAAEQHVYALKLKGAPTLEFADVYGDGSLDPIYRPVAQSLMDWGIGYFEELGLTAGDCGDLTVTIAIEGQIAIPWRQDAQGWILEAIKAATRVPGRLHRALQTPPGLSITATFKKELAPPDDSGQNESQKLFRESVSHVKEQLSDFVRGVTSAAPAGYDASKTAVLELIHSFKGSIAKAIERPLNEQIRKMPRSNLEEKQSLGVWVNEQLRELGLAIRCPKTDRPSTLVADQRDPSDEVGRFRLANQKEGGGFTRTFSSVELPALELMEDSQRREPGAEYHKKQREETKRGRGKS